MSRTSYRNQQSKKKRGIEDGTDSMCARMLRRRFREAEIKRVGNLCPFCGLRFDGKVRKPTIDHILPMSRGGPDIEDNWQLMCDKCNTEKADRL